MKRFPLPWTCLHVAAELFTNTYNPKTNKHKFTILHHNKAGSLDGTLENYQYLPDKMLFSTFMRMFLDDKIDIDNTCDEFVKHMKKHWKTPARLTPLRRPTVSPPTSGKKRKPRKNTASSGEERPQKKRKGKKKKKRKNKRKKGDADEEHAENKKQKGKESSESEIEDTDDDEDDDSDDGSSPEAKKMRAAFDALVASGEVSTREKEAMEEKFEETLLEHGKATPNASAFKKRLKDLLTKPKSDEQADSVAHLHKEGHVVSMTFDDTLTKEAYAGLKFPIGSLLDKEAKSAWLQGENKAAMEANALSLKLEAQRQVEVEYASLKSQKKGASNITEAMVLDLKPTQVSEKNGCAHTSQRF